MGEEQDQFPCNVLRDGFSEGDSLGELGGMVSDYYDILMPSTQLWEWTHQVHLYSLEGKFNDGKRNKQHGSRLGLGSTLTLRVGRNSWSQAPSRASASSSSV